MRVTSEFIPVTGNSYGEECQCAEEEEFASSLHAKLDERGFQRNMQGVWHVSPGLEGMGSDINLSPGNSKRRCYPVTLLYKWNQNGSVGHSPHVQTLAGQIFLWVRDQVHLGGRLTRSPWERLPVGLPTNQHRREGVRDIQQGALAVIPKMYASRPE